MDTTYKFELLYTHLWGPSLTSVTGQHLIDTLSQTDKQQLLTLALETTLGDSIKNLAFDRQGILLNDANIVDPSISVHIRVPQVFQLYGNASGSSAVHNLVESDKHGLFEIRHWRLPNQGDSYNLAVDGSKIDIERLKIRYFTKFQALNFYYNEVNKYFYNVCPAFYRFKVCPLEPAGAPGSQIINRVFEVEEYMG